MKNSTRLVRNPVFVLEQLENDFQIRRNSDDMAVFVNQSAAILWELCDGQRSLGEVKKLLKDAYPEAKSEIEEDINQSVSLLVEHGALLS